MASEDLDQSYFPTWKVRLTVRLEEFGTGVIDRDVPAKLTKNINGLADPGSGLEAVKDPDFPGRFLIRQKSAPRDKENVVPEASSDGLTHVIEGVIPKKFDWKANGVRTADELKASIRFSDLPIDPRVIRSCAVEFYLGTVSAEEYAQGARGMTRGDVFGNGAQNAGEPMNVVPDFYVDENGNRRSNLRFQGWVDKWKDAWSEEDEAMVELECTDNTRLLMNQIIAPRLVISGKVPLDEAVAKYLANFPQFAGLTVEYVGETTDSKGNVSKVAPIMEKVLAGTAFRPDLGPQPGKGDDDDCVWDYVTDVAGSVGLVSYLDGTRIVLARPSTILDGVSQVRPDDPYRTRRLPSGDFPARAMIWGKNLLSLEIERDMSHKESKNIEVRCYSPRRKQVLVARYPGKKDRIASSTPGDKHAENKWNIVRVRGIEDQETLNQVAKDYYNGRGRTEIEATMKTKNISSFGGGNLDPDLLDLRSADPIQVLVDRDDRTSIGAREKQMTAAGANVQALRELGYSDAFAAAYAKAYANAGFQRLFRMKEMSVTGDVDEGVAFEIKAANFIQVRGEVEKK